MVVKKETVRLRYYEIRETVEDHQGALLQLAGELGQDVETVEQVLAEEVEAC